MLQHRTDEILSSVDTLLQVHDEWERDETAPVHPTVAFEMAINNAISIGECGDIPAQCRDVCTALAKLAVEWHAYENGKRTQDHRPIGAFWGAFRDVIHARAGAEPKSLKQPEPVCMLLEQKVPHNQIGRHIWGHNGKGPFIGPNGQVDSAKILEESKEPGKHTKDWVHPEQLERQRESQSELSRRLNAASRREEADAKTIEKATVVEMLKEGQYPDVIARVKGLSLETVLDEAKRFSITPNIRPNLAAMRAPQEPPVFGQSDIELPSADVEIDSEEEIPQEEESASDADFIRSLNDGKRGITEIVAAANQAGRKVTYKQVKAALAGAPAGA